MASKVFTDCNNSIIPALGAATKLRSLAREQITAAYAAALESGRRDGKGGLVPATVTYLHRILKQALLHAGVWRR